MGRRAFFIFGMSDGDKNEDRREDGLSVLAEYLLSVFDAWLCFEDAIFYLPDISEPIAWGERGMKAVKRECRRAILV